MKKIIKSKKGFTIIEVVLVLAIAGLIFLMVFTALPALQRSQRDTQRGNDLSRLATALQNYQSNNRNRIPTGSGNYVYKEVTSGEGENRTTSMQVTNNGNVAEGIGTWGYFYKNYVLNIGSGGTADDFSDPLGDYYVLSVAKCTGTTTPGVACQDAVQRNDVTWNEQATGNYSRANENGKDNPNSIGVITNASCDGETVVYNASARSVAFIYKNEGGGANCRSNS